MRALSVPFSASAERKNRVCVLCKSNLWILRGRLGLTGPDSRLATDADAAGAEELLGSTPAEKYVGLVLDGIEVGRIALYEMLIQSKRARSNSTLKNGRATARASRTSSGAARDAAVVGQAEAGPGRAVQRTVFGESRRLPAGGASRHTAVYLHAGDNLSNRLQTLILAENEAFAYYRHLRSQWPRFEDRPCPPEAMRTVTDHLLEVSRGRSAWAYSAASGGRADLRKTFGIRDDQKVFARP